MSTEDDSSGALQKIIEPLTAQNSRQLTWIDFLHSTTDVDQKKFLTELADNNQTVLHLLAVSSIFEDLPPTLNAIKKLLKSHDLREFLFTADVSKNTAVHLAVHKASVAFFATLWKFVEENLNIDDQHLLLLKKNELKRNILMVSGHTDDESMLKLVFETFKRTLSSEEFKKVLVEEVLIGNSILNIVFKAGSTKDIDECSQHLVSKLSQCEIRKLLMTRSLTDENVLHSLIRNEDYSAGDRAWNFVIETLSVDEAKSLLLFEGEQGDNAFFRTSYNENPFLLTSLEWFTANVSHIELVLMMNHQDKYSRTSLHYFATFSKAVLAQKFFDFMNSNFTKNELKIILLRQDNKGDIPLEWSLFNEHKSTVAIFWKAHELAFDSEEFESFIFRNERFYFNFNGSKNHNAVLVLRALATERFGEDRVPVFYDTSEESDSNSD